MKSRFIAFLKQGLTPEKLALCVSLGFVLGVFPVLGSTTLLCAAVGFAAGLNQPALQSVNYLAYPLQLALLIPWYRLGERLFQAPPMSLSIQDVKAIFAQGIPHAVRVLWTVTLHAIVGWCLVAPLTIACLYFALRPFFRNLAAALAE